MGLSMAAFVSAAPDSRHFVTGEVGLGYSSILHSSEYGKSVGNAGANFQVGYEWSWRQLLLHTGVEFASINNVAKINPFSQAIPYTLGLPAGQSMTQHFNFYDFAEKQLFGQVNIPVMVGGLFNDRYYFLAGVKVGIPVYGSYNAQTNFRTTLTDDLLIGELENAPQRGAADGLVSTAAGKMLLSPVNVQASAEVGVSISSFLPQKKANRTATVGAGSKKRQPLPYYYRVALFCDYGVTSALQKANFAAEGMATVTQWNSTLDQAAALPQLTPYSFTEGRFSSLLVGVKFAMLFQVNRPKKPAKPQSWLDVDVVDAATRLPMLAQLRIQDEQTGKVLTRTTKKGKVHTRTKKGDFSVTASAQDYYSETQSYSIAALGENAELSFALRHRPYFRFRVTNADSGENLAVTASLINRATNDTVLRLTTDTLSGAARYILEDELSYKIHIAQLGYETFVSDIASIGDSMNVVLQPIKQGEVVVLNHLFFATNEVRILPQSEAALNDLSVFLSENPALRIRIVGHTDNVGSDQFNDRLSKGRADAVKNALVKRGIQEDRIETDGMGKRQPIAPNDTEEGRAQNRRVEFVIL